MPEMTIETPLARPDVAAPGLSRPDWTHGMPRDPSRLWLDKNENADPELAALTRSLLLEVPAEALWTYPELGPLYRKLAEREGVDPGNLFLAAGSDGVIRAAFETFITPGDAVIITNPTFAMYGVYSRMFGARTVALDYAPSPAGPYLDPETVLATIAAERPRLVCLPNPDSPTGTVFAPDALEAIAGAAARVGAAVLVDEAYHPFHGDTVLPLIGRYRNLMVTRTFGKAWGAAGLRIGFAAADPALATLLHKVRPMYEIGALSAAVALRLLDHYDDMRASVARLQAGKAAFQSAMRGLGLTTYQSHGNFCHVAFGGHATAVHQVLEPLVYYRRDFAEPCLKGYSRFSSTTPALIAPVIACIEQVVRGGHA